VATIGLLDDIPTPRVKEFEAQFTRYLDTEHSKVMKKIATSKDLDDDTTAALRAAAEEFRKTFLA
ncbi:MAG TPA: F0F1 ATP synthase subunit alpha, partial [Terriglobales bacterium]|nr:F0F1 ATP synthase subunit alpha [Terriglobales bacterium]